MICNAKRIMRIPGAALWSLAFVVGSSSAFSPRTRTRSSLQQCRLLAAPDVKTDSEETETPSKPQFDFSDPLSPIVFGEQLLIPFTKKSIEVQDGIVNEGPYSWLAPYLNLGGYRAGNTLIAGVGTKDVKSNYSEQEKEERRKKAAEEMINISDEERNRRSELSVKLYQAAIIYAALSSVLLDDGSFGGHLYRFAIVLPITAAYSLQLSAERGL